MRVIIYDMETFRWDWIGVFLDMENEQFTVIHNDPGWLKEFISPDAIYIGFNSKHYDQFIIKAICNGADNEQIKELNDFIIGGNQGWEHPLIRGNYFTFNNVDIRDDMQKGLSLKAIEGHLGISVEETEVDFNLDRPLTPEEVERTVKYCKHDVETTAKLVKLRKGYLTSKMQVGRMVGLDDAKALSMTNAKLTAALLGAIPQEYDDERDYQYPENLHKEYIPQEVLTFFEKMHDESIPDDVLFKSKLNIKVGDCPCVIGYGGIHAAIPNYQEKSQGTRTIRNYDVASLYPSIMIQCGYTSRSIPSAEKFENVYRTRLEAKKSGDKATANALKLVLNTTYGAMLNQYNDLFDPRMGRSVCVSGQLFILELAQRYVTHLSTVKLIQLNTDGLMVSIEEAEVPALLEINEEWMKRTGFMLEEDVIDQIIQKDVNNYVEIKQDGKAKTKGGYLVRGIAPAGAFNINNNATIVAKAISDYFVSGTPVEETILACDDIMAFQLIAKAGAKYKEAYHLVDGQQCPVQKVNRVYATTDERYGKLFKVKAEDDATAKIEMLPEHCIIDNDNHLTIDAVDKSFYIEMAKKRINDFLGIKPEKKGRKSKMATTKANQSMNVFAKLTLARKKLQEGGLTKSGKHMKLTFKYFELDDIVPTATRIFEEIGLAHVVHFSSDTAFMTLINVEAPDETVEFSAPFHPIEPIVSNAGNSVTNPMQAMGASITYMRRYLYMIALDICEPDAIDATSSLTFDNAAPAPAAPNVSHAPVSEETRQETKIKLTAPQDNATDEQIKALKRALKALRGKGDYEEYIAQIAVETKAFTVVSKVECEKYINEIAEKMEG